jgi:enoyl-CoA hydratase/carnithine racemase
MAATVLSKHGDFTVELDEHGIAHLILGQPGSMPAIGRDGHAEIGRIWRSLAENRDVRCILIRSLGKGLCAGGTPELVEELFESPSARLRAMREARALVQGNWLRGAWPAFEHSLALEFMGFGNRDAKEGIAALREKRPPNFSGE